ncbi:MAG TPA: type II toxin-antitoxin system VapC family toxin [Candidatus Dormibacteraeota bacterium]|nr:type II toxin-antitoxin system VapC family toxin [Candidatus Dormibacteraeota bacterium]
MIILDTNVVSELMRPAPERRVLHWFTSQSAEDVHITAITMAEILYAIELISSGRRRDVVRAGADKMFGDVFADRILTFEDRAARAFSQIASSRRRQAKPMSGVDAQIAAIARVHGATLATRNPYVFEGCGVKLVNPWEG